MKHFLPLFIIFLFTNVSPVISDCAAQYVNSGTANCQTWNLGRLVSNPNVPANTKTYTLSMDFKPTSTCDATPEKSILLLNAFDGSVLVPVLSIRFLSMTSYVVYSYDTIGSPTQLDTFTSDSVGWFAATIAMDLNAKESTMLWLSKTEYTKKTWTNLNIGSNLYWSKNIKMVELVQDAKLSYTYGVHFGRYSYEDLLFPFVFSSTSSGTLAQYPMLDGTGYVLGTTTKAYFGDSTDGNYVAANSPAWSGLGVKFTAANQYIKLPTGSLLTNTYSYQPDLLSGMISMQIKLDTITQVTIISRDTSAPANIYAVKLGSDGKLQAIMGGSTVVTSTGALSADTWHQINVFFVTFAGKVTASISIDGVLQTQDAETGMQTVTVTAESGTDTFKLGGFTGTVQNLRLIKLGSPFLKVGASMCLPTSCELEMGPVNTCIRKKCASNEFLNGINCFPCDGSCATCKGPAANSCLSCASGITLTADNQCSSNPNPNPASSNPVSSNPSSSNPSSSNPSGTPGSGSGSGTMTVEVTVSSTGTELAVGALIGIIVGSILGFIFCIVIPVAYFYKLRIKRSRTPVQTVAIGAKASSQSP